MSLLDASPLTLDQLRVLDAIAETGSFTAAAGRLRRATSAVSYAVRGLEEAVGLPLFDRSQHRATLLPAGEALLVEARAVLQQAEHLLHVVEEADRRQEAAAGLREVGEPHQRARLVVAAAEVVGDPDRLLEVAGGAVLAAEGAVDLVGVKAPWGRAGPFPRGMRGGGAAS